MPEKTGNFIRRNVQWIFVVLTLAAFAVLISPNFLTPKTIAFFYPDIFSVPGDIGPQLDEVRARYREGRFSDKMNQDAASEKLMELQRETLSTQVDLTPLISATVRFKYILDVANKEISIEPVLVTQVKGFAVAIYFIFAMILLMSIRLVTITEVQPSKSRFEVPSSDTTVDDALSLEARNAWMAAHRFYAGSVYLLVSGVVMSFVGMAVFAVTFPAIVVGDASPSNGQWNWLPATIRGIGLLVFVEAVAWFLLRQYRSSTEDFKSFHRIYLRRSNYLIARKALSEIKSFERSRKISEALLTEDLSGRLVAGQSTEAIEAMKIDESNPVFRILTDSLKRLSEKEDLKSTLKKATEDK